jgi:hypothetical protein
MTCLILVHDIPRKIKNTRKEFEVVFFEHGAAAKSASSVVETARGLVCSRLEKRHDLLSVAESQPFRKLCLLDFLSLL